MFVFTTLVASVLLMYTEAQIQCGLTKGKRLDTFSEDTNRLKIHLCYKIIYSRIIYKKLLSFGFDPKSVWEACITFVCSDFTDRESCEYLGKALNEVKKPFDIIVKKIEENNCYPGV